MISEDLFCFSDFFYKSTTHPVEFLPVQNGFYPSKSQYKAMLEHDVSLIWWHVALGVVMMPVWHCLVEREGESFESNYNY